MIYIQDVSPTWANTDISQDSQSVTGRMFSLAVASDGQTLYAGTFSNLWKSTDSGKTYFQLLYPQPEPGTFGVPEALGGWGAYDVAVSPMDPNLVVAMTRYDLRNNDHGIYRSVDGGASWTLVHQFPAPIPPATATEFGQIVWAPDDANVIYAAGGSSVAVSQDGGATFTDLFPWGTGKGAAYHIAVAPTIPTLPTQRFVYALGNSQMWFSSDGGTTWAMDQSPNVPNPSGGPTSGFQANAPSLMVIHPVLSLTVYVMADNGDLWMAEYFSFAANGQAGTWTQLPTPKFADGEIDSGAYFLQINRKEVDPILFYCAKSRLYVAPAPPGAQSDWHALDPDHNVHPDLHGVFVSNDFEANIDSLGYHFHAGTIWLLSDGGLDRSLDGGMQFSHPDGLATLSTVNVCGLSQQNQTALCLGTGDNSGFYSLDGGNSWKTQDYEGGDNDCAYGDPLQVDRMLVFTPRNGGSVTLYTGQQGAVPDGTDGTGQGNQIPGPPQGTYRDAWNAVSPYALRGFRPIIRSTRDEAEAGGGSTDCVFIRYKTDGQALLLRAQDISQVGQTDDWDTTALTQYRTDVFQVGPVLPNPLIEVVQASGGHAAPVFYVGGNTIRALWKWTAGMAGWRQIVPSPGGDSTFAYRFFVDPYRPNIVFILDYDHVKRSEDGGMTWVVDDSLERQLTSNGQIPITRVEDSAEGDNYVDTLINDMQFDPDDGLTRFAVGAGGAFFTVDGVNWNRLYDTAAWPGRPTSCYYDTASNPCRRSLYVGLAGRGLLKLSILPWGSLQPPDPDNWSTNTKIPNMATKASVALAVYQGLIHMVHLDNSSNQLWWSTSSDGVNWAQDVKIGNQLSKSTPALAVFQGLLYMVHADNSSNDLWIASYDGTSWSPDSKIPTMKSKAGASLAVFRGKLHLIHLDDSSNDIWWSTFDGTVWTDSQGQGVEEKLKGQMSKTLPSLAVYNSELHMLHLGNSSNNIWWSVLDNKGWWSNTRIRCMSSQATPALCVQGGLLHMMHMDDSSHDIWWSTYDGSAWTPDQDIPGQKSKAAAALSPTPDADGTQLVMIHLGDSENDLWVSTV